MIDNGSRSNHIIVGVLSDGICEVACGLYFGNTKPGMSQRNGII